MWVRISVVHDSLTICGHCISVVHNSLTLWASYQRSTRLIDYVGIVSAYIPGLCGHRISVVHDLLTMRVHGISVLSRTMWALYQRMVQDYVGIVSA